MTANGAADMATAGHKRSHNRKETASGERLPGQSAKRHSTATNDFVDRRRTIQPLVQACAECRRLKLRCSRTWPCTTCIKRGCGSVCPEGSLTGGWKQARENLIARVRVLENALTEHGVKIPPLNTPASPGTPPSSESDAVSDVEELQDGLGSLSIAEDTNSRYVGPSAGSAWMAASRMSVERQSFGLTILQQSDTQESLEGGRAGRELALPPPMFNSLYAQLPSRSKVIRRIGLFYTHLGWSCAIVQRSSAMRYLESVYNPRASRQPHPHHLAIIFLLLALGALFDPEQHDAEAELESRHYSHLARTTLVHSRFLTHPTIASLQALHMLGFYHHYSSRDGGGEVFWPVMGTAMRLIQAMGLHRDGSRWGLTGMALDERRRLFFEWYADDAFQSLCFGRPYAIPLRHIDVEHPEPPEDSPSKVADEPEAAFNNIRYRLCSLLNRINDEVFGVRAPDYSTIVGLDRKINDWATTIPPLLRFYGSKLPPSPTESPLEDGQAQVDHRVILIYERHTLACNAQEAVLFLHRRYFARALNDTSGKLATTFATSLNAVTRSCHELVAVLKSLYSLNPFGALKHYFFWYHAFGAAVCLAALIIRNPTSTLAASAWRSLTTACEIYDSLPPDAHPRKAVPCLHRLYLRARTRLFGILDVGSSDYSAAPFSNGGEHLDDEVCLSMLGVSTSLVSLPRTEPDASFAAGVAPDDISLLFESPDAGQLLATEPGQPAPPAASLTDMFGEFGDPFAPAPAAPSSWLSSEPFPMAWNGPQDTGGSEWESLVKYSLGMDA